VKFHYHQGSDASELSEDQVQEYIAYRAAHSVHPSYFGDENECRAMLSGSSTEEKKTRSFPKQDLQPWGHGWFGSPAKEVFAEDLVDASSGQLELRSAIEAVVSADTDGSNMLNIAELQALQEKGKGFVDGVQVDFVVLNNKIQSSR
jgi:hypothetical protein